MGATSSSSLRSRRALITAGLGGLAATAAHAIGRPITARAGHVEGDIALHLGVQNNSDAETVLSANLPEGTPPGPIALQVGINKGRAVNGFASVGVGVWGVSLNGDQDHPHVGVEGSAENNGTGVRGQSKGPDGTPGGSGPGVEGESSTGAGVHGSSEDGAGVEGNSQSGSGVAGFSGSGAGVVGHSDSWIGVEGGSDTVIGVSGASVSGTGVLGSSWDGAGVVGEGGAFPGEPPNSNPPGPGVIGVAPSDAPGVRALSAQGSSGAADGGLALDVIGKARFSTAGSASVTAGQNTAVVANPAATAFSHISVTLVGDPGPRQLRWVQRSPGVGFTVHFSGGPPGQRPQVPFTYLIVEPA